MWAAIAAIVGAIVTGVVAVVTNDKNVKAMEAMNEQNIAYQQQANNQNVQNSWEMFNATNEYNTPANQMERYKSAGLNPNLIYGQSNTASSVSIPTMQSPQITASKHDLSGLIGAIDKLVDVPFVHEQYQILKESAEQAKIETKIKDRELEIKDADASEAVVRKSQSATILANLDNYLKAYYDGLIAEAETKGEKKKLTIAQTRVHNAMADLKEIEAKYADSDGENLGMYELKMEAMRIANSIKDIDLDWKELEKTMGASSGFAKILLQFIKMFLGR